MAKKRRNRSSEFKPDPKAATWVKTFRLTALQRLRLTKWLLYVLTIVGCLVVQDVIMSRIRLFGATTDLAVCAIILITILEGTEVGTVFVLIASTCYYFSGSAPGSCTGTAAGARSCCFPASPLCCMSWGCLW